MDTTSKRQWKTEKLRRGGALTMALVVLFTMAITVAAPASRSARAAGGGDYRTDEVVVRLNPASGAAISDINSTYGTSTLAALSAISGAYRLRTPAGQTPIAVAAAMEGDARLLYAHPNFLNEPPEANPRTSKVWGGPDPAPYQGQYANALLHLSTAHAINRGAGIVVAVIDTGVQLSHPALAGKLTVARKDYVDGDNTPDDPSDNIDEDGDGSIDEAAGHGTHVAGIVLLVAPDARIMPIRALDSDGIGDTVQIADAIHFAVANGAHVINLSLGTAADGELISDAVKDAALAGVFVVSAAGNLNSDEKQFPGADNCAMGVTAAGSTDVKSSFSNWGSWVDITAPGEGIPSALPPSGYGTWSGTSMSAPFVAGQAALIRSMRPLLNVRQIASVMAHTSTQIDNLNSQYSGKLGQGRIDVGAAVTFLQTGNAIPDLGSMISTSCVGTTQPPPTITPGVAPSATAAPSSSPTAQSTPSTATPASTRPALFPRAYVPMARRP